MTPKTLKALRGSIEKWRRIVLGSGVFAMAFALLIASPPTGLPTRSIPKAKFHLCLSPSGMKFYSNRPCAEMIEGAHAG